MNSNLALAPDYDPTEFAPLHLLEQGDVDIWVRRRGVFLLDKSKETAKECEAGKLACAITVGASVVMSANPLAWLPLTIGAVGYIYTVFQEFQDTGSVRLIPMYRGKLGDILKVMEGGIAAERHPLEDQMEYLSEAEKDEVLLLNYRFGEVVSILGSAPPKVRFDLYRHLCDQFHARRDLLSGDEVKHYITAAVSPERRTAMPEQSHPVIEQREPKAIPSGTASLNAPQPTDQIPLNPLASPVNPPHVSLTSGQAGLEMLQSLAVSRRSTLLIGDTGSGKSVTQAYILSQLFELHPDAEVFVLSQKADSFCGLAEKGRVILFDPTEPGHALILINNIWSVYDTRRRLPESERPALSPVRLILADWLSINQALEELKSDEWVKSSKYLSKLADIIYNGRELNVCLLVDLQSYNLAAVGLKADRNSRKNFNLIGLGNYSIDELGMVNESYGVLTNLISDRYIVADESDRIALSATFKQLQPISKKNCRPLIFSSLASAQLALLPDLRKYKASSIAAAKKPLTVSEPAVETQSEAIPDETVSLDAPTEPINELKVSDSLAEPLKTIWLFAKKKNDWITVRNVYDQKFKVLEGKKVEQIHQYLGLLADTGLGEIDEEGKSHSSVGFRAY
ncbi:MAG: hypothetical protein KME25_25095 [Symplocastrum torsivum CPER-KK1]|jgi:hypothetical protein|uniref:Uncharacterized protein n=1 Tax=Symplocastrum torsivum CPER-KK1 TaxID=450513 RepID=A0A951PP81_9CYAN|nr:hypothetical protein [Symplocastrum torsivum CPER-KK1]